LRLLSQPEMSLRISSWGKWESLTHASDSCLSLVAMTGVTVGAFAGLAMLVQQETTETPVPRGSWLPDNSHDGLISLQRPCADENKLAHMRNEESN
jgi:hypothetical protein